VDEWFLFAQLHSTCSRKGNGTYAAHTDKMVMIMLQWNLVMFDIIPNMPLISAEKKAMELYFYDDDPNCDDLVAMYLLQRGNGTRLT
jgi:hypothetical protein